MHHQVTQDIICFPDIMAVAIVVNILKISFYLFLEKKISRKRSKGYEHMPTDQPSTSAPIFSISSEASAISEDEIIQIELQSLETLLNYHSAALKSTTKPVKIKRYHEQIIQSTSTEINDLRSKIGSTDRSGKSLRPYQCIFYCILLILV